MLKAGVSCSLWRKSTWSELFAKAQLGEDSFQAMGERGSVFFSICPLEILIFNSEKYNPCLVGVFFRSTYNKITTLQRLGSAVFSHAINESGPG